MIAVSWQVRPAGVTRAQYKVQSTPTALGLGAERNRFGPSRGRDGSVAQWAGSVRVRRRCGPGAALLATAPRRSPHTQTALTPLREG